MELTHLVVLKDRKDEIAYSILNSLYCASEPNSLVVMYLSLESVLRELKIFNGQPKSWTDVQRGLDAKLLLDQTITADYLRKLVMFGSKVSRERFRQHNSLLLSSFYFERSCYGDGDTVSCYDICNTDLDIVVDIYVEIMDFTIWQERNSIKTCFLTLLCDNFPLEVYKLLFKHKKSFECLRRYFFLIQPDKRHCFHQVFE
jgi:hypothetical protein